MPDAAAGIKARACWYETGTRRCYTHNRFVSAPQMLIMTGASRGRTDSNK
jgi:hypothetical protein